MLRDALAWRLYLRLGISAPRLGDKRLARRARSAKASYPTYI